jgi:hypothetical protein
MRALAGFVLAALAACSLGATGPQVGAGSEWTSPGGDAGKTHHSVLTQISAENVGTLGLAWQAELGTARGMEATPVMVGGVLYTSGVAGRAYAFDAATGKQLWAFEPEVDMQLNRTVCCDMVNRGVAVARGKVFVATLDGWLYALDAKTGAVVWKTDFIENRKKGDNSTGAPEVAGDVVVIRYEGPRGGPGMQEMLYPTSYIKSKGLGKACALVTDGRFSGGTSGLSIGHLSPEAAEGGLIGLVEDGDRIEIDIPARSIHLAVDEAEISRRRAAMDARGAQAWKPEAPRPRKITTALKAYAALTTSAARGAVREVR